MKLVMCWLLCGVLGVYGMSRNYPKQPVPLLAATIITLSGPMVLLLYAVDSINQVKNNCILNCDTETKK
jgi:uncharacterized protein with PQ loop repeat